MLARWYFSLILMSTDAFYTTLLVAYADYHHHLPRHPQYSRKLPGVRFFSERRPVPHLRSKMVCKFAGLSFCVVCATDHSLQIKTGCACSNVMLMSSDDCCQRTGLCCLPRTTLTAITKTGWGFSKATVVWCCARLAPRKCPVS